MFVRPLRAALLATTLLTAPAWATDAPRAAEAATPAAAARLIGTWKVQLDETQQAELKMMKLALRDPPPTEAELKELPEELRTMVQVLGAMRELDPEGAQLTEIRAMIDGLESARITFDATSMRLAFGAVDIQGPYTVARGQGDALTLVHRPEGAPQQTMTVRFEGATVLAMDNEAGKTTRFTRQ